VLRAAYTDRGANGLAGASSEKAIVLRAPIVIVANGELAEGVQRMEVPQMPVPIAMPNRSGSYSALKQLDLTGISKIVFAATAPTQYGAQGGKVEVRLDSATGPLVGETAMLAAQPGGGSPATLEAALKPTTGLHDVYLVFRNDQARPQQMLFVLMTATFVNGASPAASQGSR
jgi:cytochrome c